MKKAWAEIQKDPDFIKAYSEVAKSDKRALAEFIVTYIDPNHVALDVVGLLMNTRALNVGDSLVTKVRRGIEVRQLIPGQTTLSSQINIKETMNYNLDAYYVQVSQSIWELEKGEVGSASEIRSEMQKQISDYFIAKVFNSMSTLASVNQPAGWSFSGSTITRAALEDMIEHIQDVAGGVKAVIGRRTALAPVTKFAGYRHGLIEDNSLTGVVGIPSVLDEINRTGFVGSYYGARFIALDQVYNNPYDYQALIPDDLILVVGNNCGTFITYGQPRTDEWTDMTTAPPFWTVRTYGQFGMIFDNMENVGIIQLV